MAIEYNFKYMPLVGKLSGKSMAEQTETAINEIAKIVNDNTAQAEIINTLAEEANANSVEALEKANEALETSSRIYIKETGAVDLDSYCESQLIYINNIFSQNLPVASKGFLEVKTNDDKTQATQVFIDDTNKEVYTRSGAITETTVGDVTTYTASYSAWNKAASTNYVENMVLIRQNSTAYSVGDIARSTSLASYMLLECTSAGTTGASEPSYEGLDVGDVITDGSVSWTIIEYASTDYVDDSIANLKNVYLPANYLPLSGGTVTGDLTVTGTLDGTASGNLPLSGGTMTGVIRANFSNSSIIKNSDVNSVNGVSISGGYEEANGGQIVLVGEGNTSNQGAVVIRPRTSNGFKELVARPNGGLTWDGNTVLTSGIVGTTYTAEWTATVSNANNQQLTGKIQNVPIGTYILEARLPVISIDYYYMTFASSGVSYSLFNSFGRLYDQQGATRVIKVTNATNAIWLQSAQSSACNFSYLERGGIALTRIG